MMPKALSDFLSALYGRGGEFEAWLEANNEAECRAAIQAAIDEAVAKERDACIAAVLQQHLINPMDDSGDVAYHTAIGCCSSAIRARDKK